MRIFLLVAFVILLPNWLWAQSGPGVYDRAQLLSSTQVEKLNVAIRELESKTTAEVAVLTVTSLERQSVDSYANRTFNAWGIGKKKFNNGVLILVAPKERRIRIEVGYGLEDLLTDSVAGKILDNNAIPLFKENRYAEGIIVTTEAVLRILNDNAELAKGNADSSPWFLKGTKRKVTFLNHLLMVIAILFLLYGLFFARQNYSQLVFFIFMTVVLAIFLMIAKNLFEKSVDVPLEYSIFAIITGAIVTLFNVKKYFRFAPRKCAMCASKMTRLNETNDDQHLTAAQVIEEKVKSVDYDVWHCMACLNKEIEGYKTLFTKVQKCPKCQARTLQHLKTEILRQASENIGGKNEETFRCEACQYKEDRIVFTPSLASSSSSSSSSGGSSGSFGGGSSGGGGASRGW